MLQEKSACVLIDLCAGPLAPWLAVIISKVKKIYFGYLILSCRTEFSCNSIVISGWSSTLVKAYWKMSSSILVLAWYLGVYIIPFCEQESATVILSWMCGKVYLSGGVVVHSECVDWLNFFI